MSICVKNFLFCFLLFSCVAIAADPVPKGFLYTKGTKLYLDGKEFKEVSFNKYDLLHYTVIQNLKQYEGLESDRSSQELQELSNHGFRVIRIIACPFYSTWLEDAFFDDDPNKQAGKREQYFKRFDALLDLCDKNNIKIIPSLMWYLTNFADLGHHSLHEGITNPNSLARIKLKEYVGAVVTRYKDRPTIAMWELGNEWNLGADLQFEKGIIDLGLGNTALYTPPVIRDKRNNFTTDEMVACVIELAKFIKSIDNKHLLTTGYANPRPQAMHLWRAAKMGKPVDWTNDSEQETIEYIKLTHPEPIDVVQIHFYEDPNITYGKQLQALSDLPLFKKAADQLNKPLLIGEIGILWTMPGVGGYGSPKAVEHARKLLDIAVETGSPLILYWSYNDNRPELRDKILEWNMRYGKSDAILAVIEEASKKLKQQCINKK
jgi:mannan endo-1,4-beta-mannosidase